MTIVRAISLIVFYFHRHRSSQAYWRIAACAVLVSALSSPLLAANTVVHMETVLGNIDVELYDDQAPKTVANFLRYAGRGYYDGVIIHRSEPGFVTQGGGYKCCILGQFVPIPSDPPVQNEFDPSRSNVRGTIAMAKLGGDPDSATNQWFFNLADNSANLDNQNGGFTVFGRVLDPGMNVVDAIASQQTLAFAAPFDHLPVLSSYNPINGLQAADLVTVNRIPNVKSTTTLPGTLTTFTADVDMTFGTLGIIDAAITASWLETFTPSPHKTVQFRDGIYALTMTGAMGPAGRIVTLLDGAATRPNHYYAYGPTPDNAAQHWYDFSYDGTTGAEFVGNKILLHFVDGQRGDDDLTVNDSIAHTGAPVLETAITTDSSNSGGCSIAAIPSQSAGNGDWVVVSLFLAFVALVRRRARR
jgi:cyclophilin family peptidyl-prolyl cis-trans isomerase